MVAQAVAAQRLIREELASVDASRVAAPDPGPAELRTAGGDLASLHAAWERVLATLDEIDAYTAAARVSMQVTVRELTGQVERSRASAAGVSAQPPGTARPARRCGSSGRRRRSARGSVPELALRVVALRERHEFREALVARIGPRPAPS